jgi:hypothetical protein
MEELFTQLELFLIAAGGKLSEQIISSIKELPWLTNEQKSQVSGPLARLLSVVISISAGWFIGYLALRAGILADTLPIKIGIGTYVANQAWFVAGKLSKKHTTPDDVDG